MDIPDQPPPPPPHSCRICQRLVIDFGEKDDAWVERTLARRYDPHPSEKAQRGREKFCELMSLRDPAKGHPLHIRHDEIIFDFSLGEAHEAASEGCLFLQRLVELLNRNREDDDSLLACIDSPLEPLIAFQVVQGIERLKETAEPIHPFEARFRPIFKEYKRFDIVAHPGDFRPLHIAVMLLIAR
ncbi:hypothetical protein ONS95_013544 [Cadophora gregata]|uniref:uncharacterized protein n=1 Tax=Cadophora gregata TaxID=51156 RepID=UPI0026DC9EE8|nr:uncharacterized protein ONS95_013544 [Cadophora gregata]KAK0099559.1 hypothetical protein ONS96_008061 [Cadophora gregata f. sp. sojae]KAK0116530.1 hypothetical protein ONS95_013544 [Cadophora gregata]